MKTPLWTWATAGRLLAFLFVAGTAALLVLSLTGCEVVTEALRSAGVPVGTGATEAAHKVDEAIGGWFWSLLFSDDSLKVAAGAAASETVRYTGRVRKRRKERKAAKANTPSTNATGGAS